MKLILAYLVIRTVGEKFAETYVKVIVFLAAISLFGYLSDTLHLFDGLVQKLSNIPGRGYEGFFYVFRDTYHPYRNQSIFFEPGAYQAFLNAALFIIFFSKTRLDARRQWLYIIILMAALTTTFSTTGFIIFLCGFFLFLYKSEVATFYGKLVLVSIGIIIIIFFAAQFNESFVKKINDYMTANEYEFTYSAQTRSSQLKADLRVIKKHVFGLGQREYLREFQMEGRTENRGSSNGVTKILAMYGIPIGIFIFGSYYWALRRILNKPLLVAGAFVMFMLFLAGEAYYVTAPVSYAIIAAAFVIKHKSIYEKSAEEVV
jgi:O-antigen ligase